MTYYQNHYYPQFVPTETPLSTTSRPAGPEEVVRRRMLFILLIVLLLVLPALLALRPSVDGGQSSPVADNRAVASGVDGRTFARGSAGTSLAAPGLSPVFTREVRHWEPQIMAWADAFGLDPNLVAIIMQIESCGDPRALSGAGAQGLFQVMPFHFAPGEDAFAPDTNAGRGLTYFVERLEQTQGDVGRAFAGYNGGHVAAASPWGEWHPETQRYYVWATGIYKDVQVGLEQSPTIQDWLAAGGASLCRQAASRLGLRS